MGGRIPGATQGAAHPEGGGEEAGGRHGDQAVLEDGGGDDDGGQSGCLEDPGDVSHGHVADRSDRDEDDGLDAVGLEVGGPGGGQALGEPGLGRGADKAVGRRVKLAHQPGGGQIDHAVYGEDHVGVGQGAADVVAGVTHPKLILGRPHGDVGEGGGVLEEVVHPLFGFGLGHVLQTEGLGVISGDEVAAGGEEGDAAVGHGFGHGGEGAVVVGEPAGAGIGAGLGGLDVGDDRVPILAVMGVADLPEQGLQKIGGLFIVHVFEEFEVHVGTVAVVERLPKFGKTVWGGGHVVFLPIGVGGEIWGRLGYYPRFGVKMVIVLDKVLKLSVDVRILSSQNRGILS